MISLINKPMNAQISQVSTAGDMKAMTDKPQQSGTVDSVELSMDREPDMTDIEKLMLKRIKKREFYRPFLNVRQPEAKSVFTFLSAAFGYLGACIADSAIVSAAAETGAASAGLGMAGTFAFVAIPALAAWSLTSAWQGRQSMKFAESQFSGFFRNNTEAESIDTVMHRYPELAYSVQVSD